MVAAIFGGWLWVVRNAVRAQSVSGMLLAGVLMYWLVISAFLVILELPYTAIPFWTLFGMTIGFLKKHQALEASHAYA